MDVVRAALDDICTFEEDKIRNLYIYRKNHNGDKPVLMLDAHGDEVGFMIHSIKPNGTLRFVGLGRMDPKGLASSELLVCNVDGDYVRGIIGLRPPHFSGGNNGAVINLAGEGIPVVVAGVPVRYIHSMSGITAYEDFENTGNLSPFWQKNSPLKFLQHFSICIQRRR